MAWASALLLVPCIAAAFPNEPRGFGAARFGMPLADVKRAFPDLKPLPGRAPDSKAPLAFYQLEGQSLYDLRPCRVEFRFVQDQLYEVTFDCGRDDKVVEVLRREFGPPAKEDPRAVFWLGDKTAISLNPRAKTFGFVDRQLNDGVNAMLMKEMLQRQQEAQPPAGGP